MLTAYKIDTGQLSAEMVEQMRLGNPVLVDSLESPNIILMPMTTAEAEDYEYAKYVRAALAEAEEDEKNNPDTWIDEEEAHRRIAKIRQKYV